MKVFFGVGIFQNVFQILRVFEAISIFIFNDEIGKYFLPNFPNFQGYAILQLWYIRRSYRFRLLTIFLEIWKF